LIANISGTHTDQAINKRKTALSTTIPPMLDEEKLVNFVPLTKEITRLTFTHNINTERAV